MDLQPGCWGAADAPPPPHRHAQTVPDRYQGWPHHHHHHHATADDSPHHRKRKFWSEEGEDDDGDEDEDEDDPDDGDREAGRGRPRKIASLDDNAKDGLHKLKEPGSPTVSVGGVGGRLCSAAAAVASSWDLAADLEGSFSGLGGVDLSATSYNMSEALLALPPLPVLKQEAPSPTSHTDNCVAKADSNTPSFKNVLSSQGSCSNSSLHQLLQQPQPQPQPPTTYHNGVGVATSTAGGLLDHQAASQGYQLRATKTAPASSTTTLQELGIDCRFQYVLAAATSIATKVNEETLTYLNQGQSYEIKLKKLGELSAYRGKILKSLIRICFHERRLQYMEQQQMSAWRASRPGERIVEIDVPLSYGISDPLQDPWLINTVEFLWDPTKEVGVYIKVNCISTEFTPKKHGGEKGVPFRIQVETFMQGEEGAVTRLHAAACQIKVFKLKGGDRKHKQDREKIQKRPVLEQEKYQPSYDCTVLGDIPTELLYPATMNSAVSSSLPIYTSADTCLAQGRGTTATPTTSSGTQLCSVAPKEECSPPLVPQLASLTLPDQVGSLSPDQQVVPLPHDHHHSDQILSCDASTQHLALWLQSHRFNPYIRTFASFSGEDILRLSRDDLIQICGLPDGIRLFNALRSKCAAPLLTVYLCSGSPDCEGGPPELHPLFLGSLTAAELTGRVSAALGLHAAHAAALHVLGPADARVLVTDALVRHLGDEAVFAVDVLPDESSDRYRLLLKPIRP